uniref:Uncharacterized protein n=1 Tax=Ascaris lumbricoides TaxID=6252 RepID=A0A0M3HHE8_ASCLU
MVAMDGFIHHALVSGIGVAQRSPTSVVVSSSVPSKKFVKNRLFFRMQLSGRYCTEPETTDFIFAQLSAEINNK